MARTLIAGKAANCKVCGRLLAVGVRRTCQVVCTVENGSKWTGVIHKKHRSDSETIKVSVCMERWNYLKRHHKTPKKITCKVCGKKSKPRRKDQKLCMLPDVKENRGKMTPCQTTWFKMHRKHKKTTHPAHINRHSNIDIQQRICLRCGAEFESEGKFNRRCGPCTDAVKIGTVAIQRVDEEYNTGQDYNKDHPLYG